MTRPTLQLVECISYESRGKSIDDLNICLMLPMTLPPHFGYNRDHKIWSSNCLEWINNGLLNNPLQIRTRIFGMDFQESAIWRTIKLKDYGNRFNCRKAVDENFGRWAASFELTYRLDRRIVFARVLLNLGKQPMRFPNSRRVSVWGY